MPIKVSQLETRTTRAKFVYDDEGERKEEEIKVIYHALTNELQEKLQEIERKPKPKKR